MPPMDATKALIDYVTQIFDNREDAGHFITDAYGDMAVNGITEHDLSNVNMQQVINQACANANVPDDVRGQLQSYNPPPAHSAADVASQVTYATQVVYQKDEYIQNIIDQHQEVHIEGEVHGDITLDNDPQNAMAGEGGTAVNESGEGNAAVASGAGSQAIGGDVHGEVNNLGAGAQQVDTGGGNINAPIIGGDNSGIAAGGPVTGASTGDNSPAVGVTGNAQDAVFNFGGGSVTDVSGVTNSNVALGGDNVVGNTVGPGGALSSGGDASGHYNYEDNDQDNDTTVTTTTTTTNDNDTTTTYDNDDNSTYTETNTSTVTADHSIVGTEQGDGSFDQHAQQHDEHADA